MFPPTKYRSYRTKGAMEGLILLFLLVCVVAYFAGRFMSSDADFATSAAVRSVTPQFMRNTFSEKVVWITGASAGIGEALAKEFAAYGSHLILSARRESELERVRMECINVNNKIDVMVLPFDVSSSIDTADELVSKITKKFGRIDVLVNNAGRSQRAPVLEAKISDDRLLVDLNVLAPIALTKAVLPSMVKNKYGRIVMISSVAGKLGSPLASTYAATKHALNGFSNTLRMEVYDDNITVHTICPGPINTDVGKNAVVGERGPLNEDAEGAERKMPVGRCAKLIMAAVAKGIHESWISLQPILLFTYVFQYLPTLGFFLGNKVGKQRVQVYRSGKGSLHFDKGGWWKSLISRSSKKST